MSSVKELLLDTIGKSGPVTFDRFMEMALYHPRFGYYMTPREKFGEGGDFVTAPNLAPVLGCALAGAAFDVFSGLKPSRFSLIECGPGRGELMRDVLTFLRKEHPDFFELLDVLLVEISPHLARCQDRVLVEQGLGHKVSRMEKWEGRPREGMVIANELVDALPFHRVQMTASGLEEIYVGREGDRLVEVCGPLSDPELASFFDLVEEVLPCGQRAEICLAAKAWLESAARMLSRGMLVIIDYGLSAGGMFSTQRRHGTARAFYRHLLVEDLLLNPGEQDITAHVNFTALARWGEAAGFSCLGYTTQGEFILHSGALEKMDLNSNYVFNPEQYQLVQTLKMLMLPGGMGEIFKVLALYRGKETPPRLRGMARAKQL